MWGGGSEGEALGWPGSFSSFLKETSFQSSDSQNPANARRPHEPPQNPGAQVIETGWGWGFLDRAVPLYYLNW